MGLLRNDLIKNKDTQKSDCTAAGLTLRQETRRYEGWDVDSRGRRASVPLFLNDQSRNARLK